MTGALVLTVVGGLLAAYVWRRLSQSWLSRLLWHWFSGLPLDGVSRTNATWLRPSTAVLHPTGRAVRFWHLRRLTRATARTGGTFAVFGLLYGLGVHRAATLAVRAVTGLLLLLAAGWRTYVLGRRWNHNRRYVRPLRAALTKELDVPPPRLQIEADRSRVVVGLPAEFTGSDRERQAVLLAVTSKLAIEAPDHDWRLAGPRPQVIFTKSVPPPARVSAADILPAIQAAAEHEVVLGFGKRDELVKQSLDTETPHLGLCMGTGDGKTTCAMNIAAQVLWHGGLVAFLDYKLMSHMWARGLPNVAYAGTPEEIHQLLVWLGNDDTGPSELTRRKQVALASADIRGNVSADLGPRILIVAEELNATQKRLKAYWRKIGGKGPSPAAEALDEVMFTGRQLRVHALQIGQRLSAKAAGSDGSADARENLGAIVFSNPSASTWKMLCDGHVQPPASDHKGRYQVVTRKLVREMQGALWDEEAAREFATAGIVALPRHDMPFTTRVPVAGGVRHLALPPMDAPDQRFVAGPEPIVPALPGVVTLGEAAAAGMWPTQAAARKAVQRAQLEHAGYRGAAKLYTIEALATARRRKAS